MGEFSKEIKEKEKIIKLLLQHPAINVNQLSKLKNQICTPLYVACRNGQIEAIKLLLQRDDIDINKPRNDGATPLWTASKNDHYDAVKLLLGSGKHIDALKKTVAGNEERNDKTAAKIARLKGHNDIANLIEGFQQNPILWSKGLPFFFF